MKNMSLVILLSIIVFLPTKSTADQDIEDIVRDAAVQAAEDALSRSESRSKRMLGRGIGLTNSLYSAYKQAEEERRRKMIENITDKIMAEIKLTAPINDAIKQSCQKLHTTDQPNLVDVVKREMGLPFDNKYKDESLKDVSGIIKHVLLQQRRLQHLSKASYMPMTKSLMEDSEYIYRDESLTINILAMANKDNPDMINKLLMYKYMNYQMVVSDCSRIINDNK
ncbi:hypothetical protein [Candidatus Thiosymbion oneisti]|uniref:hypothetical protein n=1 Tax=Candidatus Thiosymbion oneisti TaxID=589554 RepID=UPI00105D4CB7|nr:hypothetical protein [Candidatus Thiosymbion oneisti]